MSTESTGRTVRWGVVGPGRIAESVLPDFAHVEGAEVVAVASRSQERAQAFADRHSIPRAYGGYGGGSDVNRQVERLLDQATDAARSIRLLADYLDRHPEALLRGRTGEAAER